MSFSALKKTAKRLQDQAGFLIEISDEKEYDKALLLMDELIDDYDNQLVLIELLSKSIEQWESASDQFAEFNQRIDKANPAVSTLRLLMDQHKLGVGDLPEIGSKSYVSKIMNGRDRQLTKQHIEALSKRFQVSAALFFNTV